LGLAALARESSAYLAIGYVVELPAGGFRNEATVIDPGGAFMGVFGKDHPVVFGGETSPTGGTYPVYATPIGVLGTIVCFDLDFTDTTRELARRGAQLIGVPSQDWPSIAQLHGTHLVFRAVENRVAMVKADGSFDSVIVDPYGRVLASAVTPQGGEATLVADVPLGTADAPAVRWGDWVGWACLAGWAGFSLLQAVEGRRRRVRPGG
jgi:apolipoprotein N-acyltransferase